MLHVGDYELEACGRKLTIERKSVSDFAGSIGELSLRLHKMIELDDMSMLLLEGKFIYDKGGFLLLQYGGKMNKVGLRQAQVENFILSMQMKGIMYWRTNTYNESLKYMAYRLKYMVEKEGVYPLPVSKKKNITWDDQYVTMLSLLNGIGHRRAHALKQYSLCELAGMTTEQLIVLLKNKKAAREVYETLRRK